MEYRTHADLQQTLPLLKIPRDARYFVVFCTEGIDFLGGWSEATLKKTLALLRDQKRVVCVEDYHKLSFEEVVEAGGAEVGEVLIEEEFQAKKKFFWSSVGEK